jgi:hypothetical protein
MAGAHFPEEMGALRNVITISQKDPSPWLFRHMAADLAQRPCSPINVSNLVTH